MDLTPFQIIMANRSRQPSPEEMAAQITALARGVARMNLAVEVNTAAVAANTARINERLVKAPTVTTPTRVLDTTFQVSPDYPALVMYSLDLSVAFSLLAQDTIQVTLLIDPFDPPLTHQGQGKLKGNQTLGLSVTIPLNAQKQLVGWVPAGHYAQLATFGTGTPVLITATEVIFNA